MDPKYKYIFPGETPRTTAFSIYLEELIQKHYNYENPVYLTNSLKSYKFLQLDSPEIVTEDFVKSIRHNSDLRYTDPKFEAKFLDFALSNPELESIRNNILENQKSFIQQMDSKVLEMISLYENIKNDNTLYLSNYHFSTKIKILNDMKSIETQFYENNGKVGLPLQYYRVKFQEGNFLLINTEKSEKTKKTIGMIGCYIPVVLFILGIVLGIWNSLGKY